MVCPNDFQSRHVAKWAPAFAGVTNIERSIRSSRSSQSLCVRSNFISSRSEPGGEPGGSLFHHFRSGRRHLQNRKPALDETVGAEAEQPVLPLEAVRRGDRRDGKA